MRCINCKHYPWVASCDLGIMPPMQCSLKLAPKTWSKESVKQERNCPYYEPKDGYTPPVEVELEETNGEVTNEESDVETTEDEKPIKQYGERDHTVDEFKEIAKGLGLEFEFTILKADLVKLINNHLKG